MSLVSLVMLISLCSNIVRTVPHMTHPQWLTISLSETIQTSITTRLVNILDNYGAFAISHLSTLTSTVNSLQNTLRAVNHSNDNDLFVEYNRRPFTKPTDWIFEPCGSFYDTVRQFLTRRSLLADRDCYPPAGCEHRP